jgi:sulfite exporter TauE/SafE
VIAWIPIAAAGLALGAAGSGHCAVMCGPLVALAQPRAAGAGRLAAHACAYHAGRLFAYVALGAAFGLTGGWVAARGLGRALAFTAAAALVLQAVWQWRLRSNRSWPALNRAIGAAGRHMRRHPIAGPAVFGALNGLLPCGLVYAALTAAIGLGGAANGAVFMLAFGMGTVPVLAAIGVSAKLLRRGAPARIFKRAAPIGLAIVALLLVLRASEMHDHAARFDPSAPSAHHH